jgi:hypothetical protein
LSWRPLERSLGGLATHTNFTRGLKSRQAAVELTRSCRVDLVCPDITPYLTRVSGVGELRPCAARRVPCVTCGVWRVVYLTSWQSGVKRICGRKRGQEWSGVWGGGGCVCGGWCCSRGSYEHAHSPALINSGRCSSSPRRRRIGRRKWGKGFGRACRGGTAVGGVGRVVQRRSRVVGMERMLRVEHAVIMDSFRVILGCTIVRLEQRSACKRGAEAKAAADGGNALSTHCECCRRATSHEMVWELHMHAA